MTDLRERLSAARLYLCTDGRRRQGDLASFLDAVLGAGVDIVQLREKNLEAAGELALLEVFADACRRHGRLLAVNDRADIALAAGADVLHLGQDDLPTGVARQILGPGPLIGRSSHSPAQSSAAAAEDGVDYFCAGPVWATPTKPGRPGTGLDLISHVASDASPSDASPSKGGPSKGGPSEGGPSEGGPSEGGPGSQGVPGRPWFAIGGIDLSNLDEVLAAGARRVVVVRAITEAADPGAAAAEFARRLAGASAVTGPRRLAGLGCYRYFSVIADSYRQTQAVITFIRFATGKIISGWCVLSGTEKCRANGGMRK
jgi:thiamine-phosphate pyrophosphorylase